MGGEGGSPITLPWYNAVVQHFTHGKKNKHVNKVGVARWPRPNLACLIVSVPMYQHLSSFREDIVDVRRRRSHRNCDLTRTVVQEMLPTGLSY